MLASLLVVDTFCPTQKLNSRVGCSRSNACISTPPVTSCRGRQKRDQRAYFQNWPFNTSNANRPFAF
jgi:hypothetical protein